MNNVFGVIYFYKVVGHCFIRDIRKEVNKISDLILGVCGTPEMDYYWCVGKKDGPTVAQTNKEIKSILSISEKCKGRSNE